MRPAREHRDMLTRGKDELRHVERIGKGVLAERPFGGAIAVAASIGGSVVQLHHGRADKRVRVGLHHVLEPGAERGGDRAGDGRRRIDLDRGVLADRFEQDRRGRPANPLFDRLERLIVEGRLSKQLGAFGLGGGHLGLRPGHRRGLARQDWLRNRRRRHPRRVPLRQRRCCIDLGAERAGPCQGKQKCQEQQQASGQARFHPDRIRVL